MDNDGIRFFYRRTSPNIQARIQISEDKFIDISTKTTDEIKARQIAVRRQIEEQTKLEHGILDDKTTLTQLYERMPERTTRIENVWKVWLCEEWGLATNYHNQAQGVAGLV